MQFINYALPLALAGGALANPLVARGGWGSCTADACIAAVTGAAALGDSGLRGQHCASYLATTVTPPAVTVTSTITGAPGQGKDGWKRAQVTVCPNEVPNYASACNTDAYSSACSCFGYTQVLTTTLAPTTTTKTVYVAPTGTNGGSWGQGGSGTGSCSATTVTATITTVSGKVCPTPTTATTTVTVTATGTGGYTGPTGPSNGDFCLTLDKATDITNRFADYLTNPTGVLQNTNNELSLLASDFTDTSDSINFMASIPLGSVTFNSTTAFQYGQGTQQAVASVVTKNIWFSCNSITWRWALFPFEGAAPVQGINYMIINDKGQLETNYAEFDNAAWLQDIGNPQCNATASTTKRSVRGY